MSPADLATARREADRTCRVHYSGPLNSMLFSSCCGLAVLDSQRSCPGCAREVQPQDPRERHRIALGRSR